MGLDGHKPQSIQNFGGLYTLTDATNIPIWASPNCQDVEFFPGLVKTRPGLIQVYPLVGPNANCNYTKTYVNTKEFIRTLCFYAGGSIPQGILEKEDVTASPGTISIVASDLLSSRCSSTSLFGREYLAFSDGKFGLDVPRQYDDTNLDRVTQDPPGMAPSAIEEVSSTSLAASPTGLVPANVSIVASPNGLLEIGNVVTVTLTSDFLIQLGIQLIFPGDTIKITGAGVGGYNGTWIVGTVISARQFTFINQATGLANSGGGTLQTPLLVITATTTLPVQYSQSGIGTVVTVAGATNATYNGNYTIRFVQPATTGFTALGPAAIIGLAASGGGTVSIAGNITAGKHGITVIFVDREGSNTAPAVPLFFTATGNKRVIVTQIPTGPPSTVQRIIAFTPISSRSFFYLTGTNATIPNSEMVINDNTTTSAVFDFTDALLLDGTNVDDQFDLVVLGPSTGVTSYSSRLFWWGERNKLTNLLSMSFDGGFSQLTTGFYYPLGWNPDPGSPYNGGNIAPVSVTGNAFGITVSAAPIVYGLISQPAWKDADGVPIINPNIGYSVRVRLRSSDPSTFTPGSLFVIDLFDPSTATNFPFTVDIGSNTVPTDYFAEYTGTLLPSAAFPTTIPNDLLLRVYCQAGTSSGTTTIYVDSIEIFPTNQPYLATQVRASHVEDAESYSGLDGFLNVAPENGQRVTSCFVIRNIFYMAKERSLFATQDDGVSEPANWSIQEVSSKVGTFSVKGVGLGDEWAVIAGETGLWYFTGGLIREENKLSKEIQPTWDSINWTYGHLVSVAVDPQRKRIYVSAPFGSSTVPNKVLTLDYTEGFQEPEDGVGRKWCPWSINASSIALIQRQDLTLKVFFGNSNGTGRVLQLDTTGAVHDDVLTNIDSFWQSGFFKGAARQNFGYLSGNVTGSGGMVLILYKGDMTNATAIRGWTLNSLGYQNMERTIQKQAIRLSIKFECTAQVNSQFFALQGVDMWTAPAFYAPARGINA